MEKDWNKYIGSLNNPTEKQEILRLTDYIIAEKANFTPSDSP